MNRVSFLSILPTPSASSAGNNLIHHICGFCGKSFQPKYFLRFSASSAGNILTHHICGSCGKSLQSKSFLRFSASSAGNKSTHQIIPFSTKKVHLLHQSGEQMSEITKTYTNGEVTIVWKPAMCIHSTKCWKGKDGLIDVFNPRERPWIKPEGANTEAIVAQIEKCPSGALSYYYNEPSVETTEISESQIVEVLKNGPLLVYGNITVKDKDGNETSKSNVTAFCRCGQSSNKPYCDGTHVKCGFED